MYMGSPIRPSEELRAGMVEADNICSICRGKVWTQCDNCEADICQECTVKCAGCDSDNEYCLACAVRNGHVEINGKHYCENCVPEEEHECNDCGIMITASRPICTLCERWYEERGLPLPKEEESELERARR